MWNRNGQLWISSIQDAKWQDLAKVASDLGFHGFAGALTKELDSWKEPIHESVQKLGMQSPYGGKYYSMC